MFVPHAAHEIMIQRHQQEIPEPAALGLSAIKNSLFEDFAGKKALQYIVRLFRRQTLVPNEVCSKRRHVAMAQLVQRRPLNGWIAIHRTANECPPRCIEWFGVQWI